MEERRQSDQQLGYLTGKVETLLNMVSQNSERLTRLEDNVAEKFTTIETVIRILKVSAAIVAAVLTFKFGDVGPLITKLLG